MPVPPEAAAVVLAMAPRPGVPETLLAGDKGFVEATFILGEAVGLVVPGLLNPEGDKGVVLATMPRPTEAAGAIG